MTGDLAFSGTGQNFSLTIGPVIAVTRSWRRASVRRCFTPMSDIVADSSKRRIEGALHASQVAVWSVDFSSNRLIHLSGVNPYWDNERGTVEDYLARIYRDDVAAVRSALTDARETGLPRHTEFRLQQPDGSYRWTEARLIPGSSLDGVSDRWSAVTIDVHARKLTEQRIGESERELADFFEHASVGITWIARDGTILRANKAELEMLGYSSREYVGQNIASFQADTQAAADLMRRLKAEEILTSYDARLRAADGSLKSVLISSSVYRVDGQFVHTRCITQDVTAWRQAEDRLRQSAKMEAIGQLAGGLAHDFNNQLHALSGLIDFVARDSGLSDTSKNDLAEIQNTTERMASLTRQLLAFSRQQVLVPETIDLNSAVSETRPMLQRLVGANFEIVMELAPEPRWVQVDRSQLLQVLMNLVINARDAMPRGGQIIVRTGTREVRGRELDTFARGPVLPSQYVELVVQDAGGGIAPEDITRIFDAFFTTKPVGEGTGLGLATVDGILSQSKGHIWAESELGKGATFHVLLPLAPPLAERVPAAKAPSAIPGYKGRLLVVDDEEMVREVIVRTLTSFGYEVYQADNGEAALRKLGELPAGVDLVLSDVVMPVMGGAELALKIGELFPHLPVVWMSGYPRETVIGRGRLGEDQPFIQKPVPPALLLETVANAVKVKPKTEPSEKG